jgi:23S rRNA pseudouridine2605 synthase
MATSPCPALLKRGHCVEMETEQVEKIRKHSAWSRTRPVLTLQPVIGQRKSRPMEIRVGKDRTQNSYVNGHVNEEARELRRFDHVREEKPRGRGRPGAGPVAASPAATRARAASPSTGPMGADRALSTTARARRQAFGNKAGPRDDNFGNRIEPAADARR